MDPDMIGKFFGDLIPILKQIYFGGSQH